MRLLLHAPYSLPQITDDPRNIEAVVAAARQAGAAHLWHSTLYLHDVTRDAFFNYLQQQRPALIPAYNLMYASKYPSNAIRAPISNMVRSALGRTPLAPLPTIKRLPSGQLEFSLL